MSVYTAVDVARFCDVDVKTIHNWAAKNALPHRKTPGRHLRFRRLDVIDFLRAFGYDVPQELHQVCPRVALGCGDLAVLSATRRALGKRIDLVPFDDPFDALVDLVVTDVEALVLDVAPLGTGAARCIERLLAHATTRHVRVVALVEDDGEGAAATAAGAKAVALRVDPSRLRTALETTLELGVASVPRGTPSPR